MIPTTKEIVTLPRQIVPLRQWPWNNVETNVLADIEPINDEKSFGIEYLSSSIEWPGDNDNNAYVIRLNEMEMLLMIYISQCVCASRGLTRSICLLNLHYIFGGIIHVD